MPLPEPYYSDDAVTIYHGDCRDLLPSMEANVLVTDPPYGFRAYDTDIAPPAALLGKRVQRSRSSVIFGYPEELIAWCVAEALSPIEWVTWWPTNPMRGRDRLLQRESEHIAIFGHLPGVAGIIVERSESAKRIARAYAGGGKVGADHDYRRAGDVWRDPKPGSAFTASLKLHPNEKPMTLMRRLVQMCSAEGDTIVDPFCGSGTTLRAAKDLGRHAVGIELEERYCEIAAKRCAQEVLDFAA
jgi:DNA modification methylase